MSRVNLIEMAMILANTLLRPVAGTLGGSPQDYTKFGDIRAAIHEMSLDLERSNDGVGEKRLSLELMTSDNWEPGQECNLVFRDHSEKITIIVNALETDYAHRKLAIQQIAVSTGKSMRLEDLYLFKTTRINNRIKFDAADEFVTSMWHDRVVSSLDTILDAHILDAESTAYVTFLGNTLHSL